MSPPGVRASFEARFGHAPEVVVRCPGRVNLIGDHTDYNEGWSLPTALDLGTEVAGRRCADQVLHVVSERLGSSDAVRIDELEPQIGPTWTRYVRGCAHALRAHGVDLPGAELLIGGNLPIGSGLSSSASLTLAVIETLLVIAGASIDRRDLARLGQRVENEVVGVASGIMDQVAVTFGRARHALLIDCRALEVEEVPLPADVRLLLLDSALPRRLADSGYNLRRMECQRALEGIRRLDPSLRALRDVTPELLEAAGDVVDDVVARRARHVVSENQRVLDAAQALRHGGSKQMGTLMAESHASLRDDFEVSTPDVDTLVAIAMQTDGVLGARITGAGFGGFAVALVTRPEATRAADVIATRYRRTTGRNGTARVCATDDGVRAVG